MVSVVADNPEIKRCLRRLLTLSETAGAEFSEDLVVKCIDGHLSIEAPPNSAGKILMRLPWDSLVPLEPFRLAIAGDKFVISSHQPGLTDACVAMMGAMLELYNLTNKLAAHRRTSPWSLAASHPELLRHLMSGRNRSFFKLYQNLISSGNKDGLDLYSFFQTRSFGYSDTTEAPPFLVLMPILDAMNHNYHGARFSLDNISDRDPLLTIRRSVPLPGTGDECFACYGAHDCFDIWTSYSFVDDTPPFMYSLSMTIDLPGLRKFQVTEIVKPRDHNVLPSSMKDLHFYLPQILARRKNHSVIAALVIPGPHAPRALRRTLQFLITELNPGHPQLHDLVLQAERQIITANTAYYQSLADCLRAMPLKDPLQRPILDNFIRTCDLQLGRLRDYTGYAKD